MMTEKSENQEKLLCSMRVNHQNVLWSAFIFGTGDEGNEVIICNAFHLKENKCSQLESRRLTTP